MTGWIKVYRKIQDSEIWQKKPFSQGQAWIDLILLADYEPKKVMSGGKAYTSKRGEIRCSQKWLAERWGWDRKKVWRFLMGQQSDHQMTIKCHKNGTTITLVNYGKYQDGGTTNGTTNATEMGQQSAHNQEYKELRNKKKIYSAPAQKNNFKNHTQQTYDFEALKQLKSQVEQ